MFLKVNEQVETERPRKEAVMDRIQYQDQTRIHAIRDLRDADVRMISSLRLISINKA